MKNFIILMLFTLSSFTLSAKTTVLAFAGSSRTESLNKKLVLEAAHIARELGADVEYVDLKEYPIPFYDSDFEASNGMPANAKHIRNLMIKSQVILIASPEYNSSPSALLKNTIDWISRNEEGKASREALKGKKCIIMSASPGRGGGARGLKHLKEIIEDVGGIVNPEFITVPNAYQAFDEKGKLKDPKLFTVLQKLIGNSLN